MNVVIGGIVIGFLLLILFSKQPNNVIHYPADFNSKQLKEDLKRNRKYWKKISMSRSMSKKIVDQKELYDLLSNNCFLSNPTEYGKNSKHGRLIGILFDKRIYKRRTV